MAEVAAAAAEAAVTAAEGGASLLLIAMEEAAREAEAAAGAGAAEVEAEAMAAAAVAARRSAEATHEEEWVEVRKVEQHDRSAVRYLASACAATHRSRDPPACSERPFEGNVDLLP